MKIQCKTTKQTYPIEGFLHDLPTKVLTDAMLDAQMAALTVIRDIETPAKKVALFWVTYNFEFRQNIERWLKENA